MSVPCTCKIPDPVVVNGTCLICYGDRGYTAPLPPPNDDPRPDDKIDRRRTIEFNWSTR